MIHKNIGLLRNLIAKRKQIIHLVKTYLEADSILVSSVSNGEFKVQGFTEDTAKTVALLGRTLAAAWPAAQIEYPGVTVDEFLIQPTKVALGHINHGEEND